MIRIEDLHKSYNGNAVLKGLDFVIDDGDIFGIIGQSGAGKSTILRCINGSERFDRGRIEVDGEDIGALGEKDLRVLRRDMGFIFQHFSLTERDSVFQNIALPMKCWKYPKKEINQRVNELIQLVGLEDKKHQKPRELSGGQKQRVAIARALAMKPKYLLCDEATSSLDPKTTQSILELLKDINREAGVTVVIVTHEMSVIREACSKVALIEEGALAAKGSVEDVFLNRSESLVNLMGYSKEVALPTIGTNVRVRLKDSEKTNNLVKQLVEALGSDFTILDMTSEKFINTTVSEIVINVANERFPETATYLDANHAVWEVVRER